MTCEGVKVLEASGADLGDILALLSAVDLPHEGVAEHVGGFLVARDGAGRILGTVGIERHGVTGLLRSAAVAPDLHGTGLGSCLIAAVLERASQGGIEKVVLLTSTARDFFARRFGFTEYDRTEFDGQLSGSPEWWLPRCSTAVCMALDLKGVTS